MLSQPPTKPFVRRDYFIGIQVPKRVSVSVASESLAYSFTEDRAKLVEDMLRQCRCHTYMVSSIQIYVNEWR